MAHQAGAGTNLFQAYDAWLRRAEAVITESAEALNTMNVFPISDADTGSNLTMTLRGITAAVPDLTRRSVDRAVQAAVLSAHGNSGAIVAEMFTSVGRTLEHARARLGSAPPGVVVAVLMRTVAEAATQAVARPVDGTILTVASDAATAAELAATSQPEDALAVAQAAQRGAREALERTPAQLAVLDEAGVVDAGGQAFVLLVDVLVEVLGGEAAQPLLEVRAAALSPVTREASDRAVEYEVMYAVAGTSAAGLNKLRGKLSALGHSVVVVGDQAVTQVHVHLRDPGAAIEAALGTGQLSQIRVTALPPEGGETGRTVLSFVAGPGLAAAVESLGGVPLTPSGGQVSVDEIATAIARSGGDVVILPNDMESLEIATHLATRLRTAARRIAVIPTVAQVQGLAAIAVHEPGADFDSAVVAMSRAAGHARQGAVTIAEGPAMTMAGRCERGDVLGIVESDFVEIGQDVVEVAWRVVTRLLAAGGELLTLVSGVGLGPEAIEELRRRISSTTDGVDVEILAGGQSRYLLLVGLE